MARCANCGSWVGDRANFCSQCGGNPWDPAPEDGGMAWRIEVPLLTNRFILGSLGRAFAALGLVLLVIFGGIFGWANGWTGVAQAAVFTGGALVFFALVSLFTLGVVLGNRYPLEFRLGGSGVEMVSLSGRSRLANRLALLAGVLGRNPGVAGAGVAGILTETVAVPWSDVRGIEEDAGRGVLTLRRHLLPDLHLFCPPDRFGEIRTYTLGRIEGGGAR